MLGRRWGLRRGFGYSFLVSIMALRSLCGLMFSLVPSHMFKYVNQPIESSFLKWVRFNPNTSILEVQLKNGRWHSYGGVPGWRVRGLLKAPSAGRYFNDYLRVYADAQSLREDERRLGHPIIPNVIEQSLQAISGHVPDESIPHLDVLLKDAPAMIKVVKDRQSKHGDCRVLHKHEYAFITLNESMPPYQALFTLLHELAHAEVSWRSVDNDQRPHDDKWKSCFSRILFRAVESGIFPDHLAGLVYQHALNPSFATYVDEELENKLKAPPHRDKSCNNQCTKPHSVGSSLAVWSLLSARLLGAEKTNVELELVGKSLSEELREVSLTCIRFLDLHATGLSDTTTIKRLSRIQAHSDTSYGLMYLAAVRYRDKLSVELQKTLL
jgi:hypothetical protein